MTRAHDYQQFAASLRHGQGNGWPARNWTMVVAFYAAVHYVNAYLWEVARLQPRNHEARADILSRWPVLVAIDADYQYLQDHAFRARYRPQFRASADDVDRALSIALPKIEQVVRAALPP